MQSFTFMSDEGIAAMLSAMESNYTLLGEEFEFTLNAREYNLFRKSLDFVAEYHPDENLSAWAELFTFGMASPEFSLNYAEFQDMVFALRFVWFRGSFSNEKNLELSNWAGEFLSSVAESFGVEFV